MAFKWIEKLTQLGEPTTQKGNDRDELGMALAVLMLEVAMDLILAERCDLAYVETKQIQV